MHRIFSHESEASRVLDHCLQVFAEHILRRVKRNMQLIKTRVGTREAAITFTFEDEYELHRFETIHGRAITACRKCQQLLLVLAIPLIEYNFPEPLHHMVLWREPISI